MDREVEGRKVYLRATMHDDDRLCAEAKGLFIVLNPGQPRARADIAIDVIAMSAARHEAAQ